MLKGFVPLRVEKDEIGSSIQSFIAKTGENMTIELADKHEMDLIQEFVVRIHLDVSGYSENAKNQQINELPDDFPEFYDDDIWESARCWKCLNNNGDLIGVLGIRHYCHKKIYLSYFFVEESYRSSGIGQKLWNTFFSWLQIILQQEYDDEFNYEAIHLVSLAESYKQAISFYQRNGFALVKELQTPHYLVYFMELDINHLRNQDFKKLFQ